MEQMDETKVAEEHAEWYANTFTEFIRKVYKDAFLHGFKHGEENKK